MRKTAQFSYSCLISIINHQNGDYPKNCPVPKIWCEVSQTGSNEIVPGVDSPPLSLAECFLGVVGADAPRFFLAFFFCWNSSRLKEGSASIFSSKLKSLRTKRFFSFSVSAHRQNSKSDLRCPEAFAQMRLQLRVVGALGEVALPEGGRHLVVVRLRGRHLWGLRRVRLL